MRVAINHTQFTSVGGSERYIFHLVKRLLSDGHEVHYYCSRVKEPFEHPRFTLHHVPRGRGVRFWKVLSFARNSARILKAEGPFDVIHGFSKTWYQDVYTDGSGLQSAYREFLYRNRGPLARAIASRTPYQKAVDYCERKRFEHGNFRKILTMSRFVKDQIQGAYGLADAEIEVLYNGIDCTTFSPDTARPHRRKIREKLDIPEDAVIVLFVGSDYGRKNLDVLLRAALRLRDRSNLHVVVCGRDNHESRYRSQARAFGLERVHFCGLQPNILEFFGAADLLCLPSFYDVFGMVVLEAMACAVPAIVSAKAGASEVVSDGRTGGILIDPEDDAQLTAHIERFLSPALREEASREARAAAISYGWDAHMKRLYEVYEQVARGPQAGPSNPE